LIMGPAVLLPRLAAFCVVLILTHTLSASEFGYYALVILVGDALDTTASFWIRFTLLRLDISNPGGWRSGFRRSYVLSIGSTIVSCIIALAASQFLAPARSTEFFIAVSAYAGSNTLLRIGLTSLQMRQKIALVSALECSRSLLQLAIVLLVVLASNKTFFAFNVFVAIAVFWIGVAAIGFSRSGIGPETQPSADYRTRIKYGASLIVLTLLSSAVLGSDRYFLKVIGGAAFVGLYSAAYALGRQPIDMIGNAINQGGFPELMKRFDAGGLVAAEAFLAETFELYVLLISTAVATLWCLAPTIAVALLPPPYRPAAGVLIPLIALAGALQTIKTYVFDNIFHMYRRNWAQVASYFPAAITTIVAAYILIKPFGAVGAGATALAGMSAGLIGSVLITRRLASVRVNLRELVNSLLIAALTGAAGFVTIHLVSGIAALPRLIAGGTACGLVWCVAVLSFRPLVLTPAINRSIALLRRISLSATA